MKIRKILIIGFGNIGVNHLNGIFKYKSKVEIFIYDKKYIQSHNFENINKNINILNSLKINKHFDLVIISTNSEERFKVFLELVKYNTVRNIIFEKFVYYKKYQFEKTLKILEKKNINAWVNCLRREISIFKNIKKKISKKFELIYQNSNWGLGCNSIHFLDLFGFFIGREKISLLTSELNKRIYKSKRKGYVEFKGKVVFKSKNSTLVLEDNKKYKDKIFKIKTKNRIFLFNNKENILIEKNKKKIVKKYKCFEPKVSNVTYNIIKKISQNKKIYLTNLNESFYYHKILIELFSDHIRRNKLKGKFKVT